MLYGSEVPRLAEMSRNGLSIFQTLARIGSACPSACFLATYRLTLHPKRLLETFQAGEPKTFIEHIRAGLDELARNERAILVFSGYVCSVPRVYCGSGIPTSFEQDNVKLC
jgi:hypothetical protein